MLLRDVGELTASGIGRPDGELAVGLCREEEELAASVGVKILSTI